MLKALDQVSEMILSGDFLHISGCKDLLERLPKGNWIGGSIECFMSNEGGIETKEKLFVNEIPFSECKVCEYNEHTIKSITKDAFENGFTILIMPFASEVAMVYAKEAPQFEDIFFKNIVGWVSGYNMAHGPKDSYTINGQTKEMFTNRAVALHVSLPDNYIADIGIINIFTPDENSPVIEFKESGLCADKCLIDGKEYSFVDYINENNIDTRFPIIGDYYGPYINTTIRAIENGVVNFASSVFEGIKYRFANSIEDYPAEFRRSLEPFRDVDAVFSCNCMINFMHGELEGKHLDFFHGPMTFGEVAFQLLNQTLVYLVVKEK